jgi:hypothetical protein
MTALEIFSYKPSSRISAWIIPGGKGLPVRKVHNFTAICF